MGSRNTRRALIAVVALGLAAACAGQGGTPGSAHDAIVTVPSGVLRGLVSGGVRTFLGIPYAAPPVGALRWLAPQAAAP